MGGLPPILLYWGVVMIEELTNAILEFCFILAVISFVALLWVWQQYQYFVYFSLMLLFAILAVVIAIVRWVRF